MAMNVVAHCDKAFRARLTSWLIERRRAGEDRPKVYARNLESIKKRNILPVKDRALNLLVYISRTMPDMANDFWYETKVDSADYYKRPTPA